MAPGVSDQSARVVLRLVKAHHVQQLTESQYRANVTNRRQNRTGHADHGEFDGLPVRHWRRDYVTVAPPQDQNNLNAHSDIWAVELPLGMPKDAHLLPQHCQDLLRAARSGKIYKRPAAGEEEEVDPEAVPNEKPEKKEEDMKEKTFSAKAWKQIPRHQEGPDNEYLAKRRKNLVKVPAGGFQGPDLTTTTMKKMDAAGNDYAQDVIMAPEQVVEGEFITQTPLNLSVEGGLTVTPPRRKGPVTQKKKKGGPGRGKRKALEAPTSVPQALTTDGRPVDEEVSTSQGEIKDEDDQEMLLAADEDTEVVDDSVANSEEDDAEEGDIDDDDDGTSERNDSPSKPGDLSLPSMSIPEMTQDDDALAVNLPGKMTAKSTSEDTATEPLEPGEGNVSHNAGSLKRSRSGSPIKQNPPSKSISEGHADGSLVSAVPELMQVISDTQDSLVATPNELPSAPPGATAAHEVATSEVRLEEEQEETMLLDIVEEMDKSLKKNASAPKADAASSSKEFETLPRVPIPLPPKPPVPIAQGQQAPSTVPEPIDTSTQKSTESDEFPDLLGGLERSLNAQEEQQKVEQQKVEPPNTLSPNDEPRTEEIS